MADVHELTFRAFARLRKPLLKSQLPFLKDCQIQARLKKQWSIRKGEWDTTRRLSELNKTDSQGVDGMTEADKIKQGETNIASKHSTTGGRKSASSDCLPAAAESNETFLDSSPFSSSSRALNSSSSSFVKKLRTRKAGNQRSKKVKHSKATGGKARKTKLVANSKLDSGVGKMVSGYPHHSCDSSESSPPPLSIDVNACQTVKPYPLPAISQSGSSQCEADLSPSPHNSVCSNDSVNTRKHKPDHSVAPSFFYSSPTSSHYTADEEFASLSNKPASLIIRRSSRTRIKRQPLLEEDKLAVTRQALCADPHQEGLAQLIKIQHEEETVEENEGEGKEERCGRKNMTCSQWREGDDDAFFISKCRKEQQHVAKVDGGAMCALFLPLQSTSPQDDSTNQIESVPDTDNDDSMLVDDEDSIFL